MMYIYKPYDNKNQFINNEEIMKIYKEIENTKI